MGSFIFNFVLLELYKFVGHQIHCFAHTNIFDSLFKCYWPYFYAKFLFLLFNQKFYLYFSNPSEISFNIQSIVIFLAIVFLKILFLSTSNWKFFLNGLVWTICGNTWFLLKNFISFGFHTYITTDLFLFIYLIKLYH